MGWGALTCLDSGPKARSKVNFLFNFVSALFRSTTSLLLGISTMSIDRIAFSRALEGLWGNGK